MRKVTADRVVVLGMGLLGGVAAAAASLNAHNILLDFDDLAPADISKARDVTLGKCMVAATEKCVKGMANSFESCLPTREHLQQVHAFIGDLLPSVTATKTVQSGCSSDKGDNKLLRMCVMLVTLFAHRMKCRKENYTWLLYVYYARLKIKIETKK